MATFFSNPGRPLLIIHIPKTAGTTFRKIVEAQYPENAFYQVYPPDLDVKLNNLRDDYGLQETLQAVMGHVGFGIHEWFSGKPRYITFFRDPISQVLSHYNHLMNSDDPVHRDVLGREESLDDFLEHEWSRNLQTRFLTGLDQHDIEADQEYAFQRSVMILNHHFACFGIVEYFEKSLFLMHQLFHWQIPVFEPLNRSNERPKIVYRKDLDASLIERIKKANSCDMRLYDFAVRAFWRRVTPSRIARVGTKIFALMKRAA